MILFGPSGNSDSFYAQGHKHTYEAFSWIKKLGLGAYEYSFGRGVRVGQPAAEKIGAQAASHGIFLSVHAPYYINLATDEKEKREGNIRFFLKTAQAAKWMGAKRIVFHPGSESGVKRDLAFARVKESLFEIIKILDSEKLLDIEICPETMGRIKQIGDLTEVIELCAIDERLVPAVDFGHLHARGLGALKTRDDFRAVLDELENSLGGYRARRFHVHFSRIEYSAAGERKHHTFADTDYGPDFSPLAYLLAKRRLEPVIICESKGTMAEDAVDMKKMYEYQLAQYEN
ncbi:MAG: TIM barrel protein [Christensenellales bacterium]